MKGKLLRSINTITGMIRYTIFILHFCTLFYKCEAQSDLRNYVKSTIPKMPVTEVTDVFQLPVNDKKVSVVYLDAFGRPIQSITENISPMGRDVVQGMEYTTFGAPLVDNPAYTINAPSSEFRADWRYEMSNFYLTSSRIAQTSFPSSEIQYENSPFHQISRTGSPGEQGRLETGRYRAIVREVVAESDAVIRWRLDQEGKPVPSTQILQEGANFVPLYSRQTFECPTSSEWNYSTNALVNSTGTSLKYTYGMTNVLSYSTSMQTGLGQIKFRCYKSGNAGIIANIDFFTASNVLISSSTIPSGTISDNSWGDLSIYAPPGAASFVLGHGGGPFGGASDYLLFDDFEVYGMHPDDPINNTYYYKEGDLFKIGRIDEDGLSVLEFYNSLGQLILSRKEKNLSRKDTYYVYNKKGLLAYIIPPLASEMVIEVIESNQNSNIPVALLNLCFEKRYDGRGRLIYEKSPDSGGIKYVYNTLNQIIMSQDANQEILGDWNVTKYDILGRVVCQTLLNWPVTREVVVNSLNAYEDTPGYMTYEKVQAGGSNYYYSNHSFPNSSSFSNKKVLYYDTYHFTVPTDFQPTAEVPAASSYGKMTGSIVFTDQVSDGEIVSLMYYDRFRRPNESFSETIKGSLIYKTNYTWYGLTISTEAISIWDGATDFVLVRYEYDGGDRIQRCFHKVNDDPEVTLYALVYNELGQVVKKRLFKDEFAQNYMQTIDYRYNERGWLKKINNANLVDDGDNLEDDDVFGQELFYWEEFGSSQVATPRYNGAIAGMKWKSKPEDQDGTLIPINLYTFSYDWSDQLIGSRYSTNDPVDPSNYSFNTGHFDEILSYDLNGNVIALERRNGGQLVDDLTLKYNKWSNRIQFVTDNAATSVLDGFKQFHTSQVGGESYQYDLNGNLISDTNKGLVYRYDELNLLTEVTVNNSLESVQFIRDSEGTKLIKRKSNVNKYYVHGFEYDDNGLIWVSTPEGIARRRNNTSNSTTEFVYDFYITDHVSNIRAVITNEEAPLETSLVTSELERRIKEESEYDNVNIVRGQKPLLMPADNTYGPNIKVSELTSTGNQSLGPAKLMKIRRGDSYDIGTKYWYTDVEPNSIIQDLPSLILAVTGSFSSAIGSGIPGGEQFAQMIQNPGDQSSILLSEFLSNQFEDTDLSRPAAYLVYMVFDSKLRLDAGASGKQRVQHVNTLSTMNRDQLAVRQDGYLYVFLVNGSFKRVYFDNLYITRRRAKVLQYMDYYPFGLQFTNQDLTDTRNQYGHTMKEMQDREWDATHGLDWEDFGARMYDPVLCRWWSVDPLAHIREWLSPYNFVQNNPIIRVDPAGAVDSPIYDQEGNFLGTDDEGLQGKPIVMKKEDFTQGMKHEDAMKKDLAPQGGDQYLSAIPNTSNYSKFYYSFNSLSTRPDYDGYLTKAEADAWWLSKKGTPLYVDRSKIDLPDITTKTFDNKEGTVVYNNFVWGLSNTGKVYGTLRLSLQNASTGAVHIGGQTHLDEYDFKMDGRWARDFATWWGRPGGENDGKDFFIYGYGQAKVPVVK